jgi:hypothetical protein
MHREASRLWPFSLNENGTRQNFKLHSNGEIALKHRMAKIDTQKAEHPKRNQQQRPPPLNPRRLFNRH